MKLEEKKEPDFPDEKTLKKFRDKLSNPEYEGVNIAPPEDSNEIDWVKSQLSPPRQPSALRSTDEGHRS